MTVSLKSISGGCTTHFSRRWLSKIVKMGSKLPKGLGKKLGTKRLQKPPLSIDTLLTSIFRYSMGAQGTICKYIYINKYVHVTYIIYKYIRAKSPGYHQNCWQIATLWIIWGSSSISQGGDRPPNQIYITKNNNKQIKITNAQFGQHHKLTSHRHNIETCGKITWFLFLKQTNLNI